MASQYLFRDGVDNRPRMFQKKLRMGLCVAHDCFNHRSRSDEHWCTYHLGLWDTGRRTYELLRVSASCVYCCVRSAEVKRVTCTGCEEKHKRRVELCVEQHRNRLDSWAFSQQEYHKTRLWLTCGLPAEFLKTEGYGWDVTLQPPLHA